MLTFIEAYIQAFHRHYPDKEVSVRPRRQANGSYLYAVLINGDAGNLLLSESDMRDATRAFLK